MVSQQFSQGQLSDQQKILITGASSCGKSEFAEILATKSRRSVVYLPTAKAEPADREWQAKIRKHQQRRPESWYTPSTALDLSMYLKQATALECLLIDSLGTWVANFIELDDADWQYQSDRFLSSLQATKATAILVGEETGWGIVPAYPMGRLFRDRLGHLSRQVSNLADTAYLVVAGHVINLSLLGEPLSKYKI